MTSLDILIFFSVEYLPEEGRKRPKHVGGLPHVCISLYHIIVQLLVHIRRINFMRGKYFFSDIGVIEKAGCSVALCAVNLLKPSDNFAYHQV
jgi:hypothetical protein